MDIHILLTDYQLKFMYGERAFQDPILLSREVLKKAWSVYQKNEASALFTVKTVLSDTKLWGINLSADVDLTATIAKYTHAIITDGVVTTMRALLELN